MDKNTSAGTMHFRSKLLQAVSIMPYDFQKKKK
jgi:hypothetical protein